MLHAGLDLSRKKIDVCLLSEQGEHLDQLAVPPDADALRTLARRIAEVHDEPVCAVIESMTGARIVHDTLEQEGWAVEIADAQRVKGLAPLACKTDKIDSLVLATLRAYPGRSYVAQVEPDRRGRTSGDQEVDHGARIEGRRLADPRLAVGASKAALAGATAAPAGLPPPSGARP